MTGPATYNCYGYQIRWKHYKLGVLVVYLLCMPGMYMSTWHITDTQYIFCHMNNMAFTLMHWNDSFS